MNAPQTLRDLVVAAKESRATSARQLAFAAQRHGFKVVDTTLNAIAAGTYKSKPSDDTIRAIAWLADVSDEVAFAAAGVPMPGPPFAEELPPGVDYLSQPSRKAAVEILRALVRAERAGEGDAEQPAPKTQEPSGSAPTAGSKPVRNIRAWQGETPPPIDELEERRRRAEAATDEAMKHPEQHAAQGMPEGGTEYQKRVREQDEAAETGDVTPEEEG